MRKRRHFIPYITLFLLALTLIAACVAKTRSDYLSRLDISVDRRITADGTVYDLRYDDNDTMWLREISPDGTLIGHIPFSTRSENDYPVSYHILAARNHLVYLYIYTRSYDSSAEEDLHILVCDTRTGTGRILYQPEDQESADLISMYAEASAGGDMFFGFEYEQNSDKRLKVSRMNPESGAVTEWLDVPADFSVSCFAVTKHGKLFAASEDSSVYRYDRGSWVRIFKPDGRAAISQLFQGNGGTLYLFLTGTEGGDRLLRLAPGEDAFETVREDITYVLSFSLFDDDTALSLTRDFKYQVSLDGERRLVSSLKVPFRLLLDTETLLNMLPAALAVLVFLLIARHLRLKLKTGLIVKLIVVSAPIFVLGSFLLIRVPSQDIKRSMDEAAPLALLSEASRTAAEIDGSRLANINWEDPWSDEYYLSVRADLEERTGFQRYNWWGAPSKLIVEDIMENKSQEGWKTQEVSPYVNYWLYRVDNRNIYSAICGGLFVNLEIAYFNPIPRSEALNMLIDELQPVFVRFYDEEFWLALLYPILDDNNQLVAVLEVSRSTRAVKKAAESITRYILLFSVGVFTAMLLSFVVILALSLRNLGRLKRGALLLRGGDYSVRVSMGSRDEIGDIARAFNGMADSVERHMADITAVSKGYGRFVPDEMLTILRKDSIQHVGPADYSTMRAMFLLLTTDSFDKFRDEQYLNAINRFYSGILPVLSGGGGVVERFTGHELRAMFDCSPHSVLNTVLDMFASLNRLNAELVPEGHAPVECSVLLSSADSFLGVAGNDKRLNMILLSRFAYKRDSIRVVGLRYGCSLMLDQAAYEGLGGDAVKYRHRLLGYIDDNGERLALYDFYDSENAERSRDRDITRNSFEQAVLLYYNSQYERARAAFIDIVRQTPDDLAAREYLKRSHAKLDTSEPPEALQEL